MKNKIKQVGYTPTTFAKAIGRSRDTIYRWMNCGDKHEAKLVSLYLDTLIENKELRELLKASKKLINSP